MMRRMEGAYHTPVLLKDCIEALQIQPDGIYVDATFGGGGHSGEILRRLKNGKLFSFDCDEEAARNRIHDKRFTLIPGNFRELKKKLLEVNVTLIDGLLADLGVSSHQFDSAERGFSTRFDAVLDMRMDKHYGTPASELLRSSTEADLKKMFSRYGELRNASQVARQISANREKVHTVNRLKETLARCAPKGKENQFYAKVFQALRIAVNDELNALKEMLMQSVEVIKPGGRIAVIAYHSLEDRIVKSFFRSGQFEGEAEKDLYGNVHTPFRVITRQPIVPDVQEINRNSRARSAKLRIAERTNEKSIKAKRSV